MSRPRILVVLTVAAAVALAACGSSSKSSSPPTTKASTAATPQDTTLGTGVTDTSIKVGVSLVDFSCIRQFTDSIREHQEQIYGAYINDINAHGGIAGRKIEPVYRSFCPIGSTGALQMCTKFTEDDKVFMVIGNLVDFSGDAQTCVAKTHKTPLMTFQLTQAILDKSPPGLIVLPGATPERTDRVVAQLMKQNHTLDGKKIAILGETSSAKVVKDSVEPAMKTLGIPTGTTGIVNITGSDTTAAQTQLDSFIERWKGEGVTALFVSGTQVAAKQFIERVKDAMPNVQLVTDITDTKTYGQEENVSGRKPNPYEGIISAAGPTAHEYDQSANWKYCAAIYKAQTGAEPPNAETDLKTSDGKKLDTYGGINDACQILTMVHDIGTKVGKYLNASNWQAAVDNYGPIRNMGSGQYASLHSGKYDVDDSFRLVQFDSSIPTQGDWKAVTPLQDITGASS